MNDSRQFNFHSALAMQWATLLFVLGLAMINPDHTLATDLPVYGGSGGDAFRDECPKGSYLVGVDGRYGAWVDRIAPVCAPWLPAQKTFGAPTVGKSHGTSRGGGKKQILCWGFGINNRAVQSWGVTVNRSRDHYVNALDANCVSLAPPAASGKWGFGRLPDLPFIGGPMGGYQLPEGVVREVQACPPGELAVGIHGRAGLFVDAIGLICGPAPVSPPMAATKVNPRVEAPTTAATNANPLGKMPVPAADMFLITRPGNGDPVQQGQLVVMAQPPKIGATSVTVLEFTWLDAPNTQPYSPTVFGVETSKLLQGYRVDHQELLKGPTGRWQVRARNAAQPTPGPWSFPVQFQLFRTQQVQSQQQASPMVQQTPLPSSSVTQAPASSGSATTQMRRSPSMIMPRGVDEKEAGSETPAPTEPAKKP